MMLLRRHLLPLLRAASPLPSPIHHHPACPLLSTSASAAPFSLEVASPFSLEDYLVATCGLAPAVARKAAQTAFDEACRECKKKAFEEISFSRLNSASNPNAIIALLSGVGLARADIAALVAAEPLLLRSSVKNVGPRLLALRDRLGWSTPQIARFLLAAPRILRSCDFVPKVEFFISFFGSFEQLLVMMKKNNGLLSAGHERVIKTNIALLRQCGISVRDIAHLCSRNAWIITLNPERVKELVQRAEELGVPRSSRMFKYAVLVSSCITKENVAARIEFLKRTLGCSENEVATAVSRYPTILGLSEEHLLRKIQFLINEVGLEPRYIVQRPTMLGYSLEKRLVPRHCVMKVLQAEGLLNSNTSLFTLACIGEKAFRLKYIECHKDSVPGLADYYATCSACDVPPKVQLSS